MSDVQERSAKVSSKGQVVIPVAVRQHLGLVHGSVLRFQIDADGVRLLAAKGDVRRLKGRLAAPKVPVTIDDMSRAVIERRATIGADLKR